MNISLALMTGSDIVIEEFGLIMHQPTLKDISLLGEDKFFLGLQLCGTHAAKFIEGKDLSEFDPYTVLYLILTTDKNIFNTVSDFFNLIFPDYTYQFNAASILFTHNNTKQEFKIIKEEFDTIQKYIFQTFRMEKLFGEKEYNTQSKKAAEIAKKLQAARQKVNKQKTGSDSSSMIGQYISVLSIGLQMSPDEIVKLTLFQFYDLIERYSLYTNWDLEIRSRLAGSTSKAPIPDWTKPIY